MNPPRPIIVVLGSGRSGTSLLMQALASLGMRVSARMVETRPDNPEGFFEDARIVQIQADLLRALGAWPFHPLPPDWRSHPATATARGALMETLAERGAGQGGWGFKDPRTASFLPLWQEVFAVLGLTPRYLLALRSPGSILRSFMAAYGVPPEVAEQVWMQRTADALGHTQARCHVVHYEDWFCRGEAVAEGLARFAGLGQASDLSSLVRPDLNRSAGRVHVFSDPRAQVLDAALQACRGDSFDREALLATVADCRGGLF